MREKFWQVASEGMSSKVEVVPMVSHSINPMNMARKKQIKLRTLILTKEIHLIDKDVMGLGKNIKLKVVTGKKSSKKAARSKMDFVYDGKKGLLYFNENGKEEGWGDGGLFAKLHALLI